MTAFLLDCGADPNAIDDNGNTPLYLVIRRQVGGYRYNDPQVNGQYAVETLSNIITDYKEEGREVWETINHVREQTVRQLLKKQDININIANNNGQYLLYMILFEAARIYLNYIVLSTLLDHEAQVSSLNSER